MRLLIFAAILAVVNAACPNKCSGHGSCVANDKCECDQNWVNADCSGRQCPSTRAWQDTAIANNDGHYFAECGNRGLCDRSSGVCTCDAGFTGSGCRRMDCPNQCSGHGVCKFIEELAADTEHARVGGVAGRVYTGWDQEKIMGCACDPWYEGYACQKRVCPMGDDPLTTTGSDMQQYIQIPATIQFVLTYKDPYGNAWTTPTITAAAGTADTTTCGDIQTALNRLPNRALHGVTVATATTVTPFTRTAGSETAGTSGSAITDDNSHITCLIYFPSRPGTTGRQNIIACDTSDRSTAGYQPKSAGGAGSCLTGEHNPLGGSSLPLTELVPCSGRGACDPNTGLCQCYSGHRGLACERQEALV